MPYLSFDLDALEKAPEVAAFAGMDDGGDHVVHGLLKLWRNAWRQKSDVVTRARLHSFFHRAEPARIEASLAEFGFVAAANDNTFRVKGAERYLRISNGRSKGGKAASGNLKRGNVKPGGSRGEAGDGSRLQPGRSRDEAGTKPGEVPGCSPALQRTANSEQRAALTTPPACAREEPLCDRLGAAFRELRGADYSPSPADEQAMSGLLRQANGNEAEIARRYRIGLGRTRFPSVTTWVDLNKHWNACAAPETRQQAPPNGSKPPANVSSSDWDGVPTGEVQL